MENIIFLSNRETLLTDTPGIGYRVVYGSVHTFLAPVTDGIPGRRIFLKECGVGEMIPAICCRAAKGPDSEETDWAIVIVPADKEAQLTPAFFSSEEEELFFQAAGIENYTDLGFEEAALEFYRLRVVLDLRNIYSSEHENDEAQKRTLRGIYNLFRGNMGGRHAISGELTHSNLYNAVSAVCQWLSISCASIDVIQSACGKKFNVTDIARISGFVCREIVLDENWFRTDAGPILGYFGKEGLPVACLPKNGNSYYIYYGNSGGVEPLTPEIAKEIKLKAVMVYRPFPRKKMAMRDLASFAMKELRASDIVSIIIMAILGILIGLLIPYINEQIYDLFIPLGDSSGLLQVGAVVLACTSGNLAFTLVQTFCGFRVTSRMKYSLQAASIDRLFNLPESFYGKYDSADLARRALDIPEIFGILADSVVNYGLNLLFSLFYLIKIFSFQKKVAWASIFLLAATAGIIIWLGFRQIPYERERNDYSRQDSSLLYQLFSGVNKLRLFNAEERGLSRYMAGLSKESMLSLQSGKYKYAVNVIAASASTVFSIVFFYLIVKSGDTATVGKYMGFSSAFGALSAAVMEAAKRWLTVNDIIPYFEMAKPILEELPEKEENVDIISSLNGAISVEHLTFGYRPDVPVLRDISFSLRPGEYVGIVGSSGCGKSTLFKLLLGFEKPQQGKIYYDGQDIENIDKRELRKQLGVVLQNGGIIAGSIYDNITISCPNARLKDVKEAIREVGLEQDIEEMPMKLHTVLSEGSGGISGGQKQRILIARAIVGKPKILFFDEATSALDNNTQAQVCESLEKLNATRVVIAHRLSTIMHCDRILVLNQGQIVEEGNYEELMEMHGLFYKLAERQIT